MLASCVFCFSSTIESLQSVATLEFLLRNWIDARHTNTLKHNKTLLIMISFLVFFSHSLISRFNCCLRRQKRRTKPIGIATYYVIYVRILWLKWHVGSIPHLMSISMNSQRGIFSACNQRIWFETFVLNRANRMRVYVCFATNTCGAPCWIYSFTKNTVTRRLNVSLIFL